MNEMDLVQYFVDTCAQATRMPQLSMKFQSALQHLGFRYFACGSHVDPLNPQHAVMILNYPQAWVQVYSEQKLHLVDPVFRRADRAWQPFYWNAADFLARTTPAQRRMLREARHFGVENGFTIPIHTPQRHGFARGSCSVIPDSPKLGGQRYLAAQLMAGYLFGTAARLSGMKLEAIDGPQLTPRQRQCVDLIAQGKSNTVIAQLLGLSPCTVHHHIERAKARFQVATRQQLLMVAIATGQISFAR